MTRRQRIEQALRENCIDEHGDTGIHSWRCGYPNVYGPCDCFTELVNDIERAIDKETP